MSETVTLKMTNVTLTNETSTIEVTRTVPEVVITGISGPAGPTWTGYYGSFTDTTIQTISANTATAMTFNTTEHSNGVSIGSPASRIVMTHAGVYNIQFSAQMDKTDSGTDVATIWLRINGTDVPRSATSVTLTGNNTKLVAAWNFVDVLAAGQYIELMWSSADSNIRLYAADAQTNPVRPAIPSVILTVTQVQ